ncbi:hypothetical protein [Bradyrhizobium sp. Tv2a-2]|uniref:hypothetical protein n=1 Tax=Bradyrhizobium sp. Tv2a-2 TaxID=113395 RepID=UPI000466572C|nr:hypothetical protein [Bradyrhizobium sp. Tv2a-2]
MRRLTSADDPRIMALWKKGLNTATIARELNCREFEVANRLAIIRGYAPRSEGPNSIVGQIAGDPPKGRSALDQMVRREGGE